MSDLHIYSPEWGGNSPCSVCTGYKEDHKFTSEKAIQELVLRYIKEHYPKIYYDALWQTETEGLI